MYNIQKIDFITVIYFVRIKALKGDVIDVTVHIL